MAIRPTLASTKAGSTGENLSKPERVLSMAGGGALLINGLRTGGLRGVAQLAMGGWTLWRGYKGRCELKAAMAHTPLEQEWEAETGWPTSKVVSRSITVNKPLEEVIAWCRDPANIGPLIPWVDAIEQTTDDTYRWTVRGPGDRAYSWTLIQSEPDAGRALRWNTPGEGVWQHEADARFTVGPRGEGTEITLVLATQPPKGAAGYALASMISRFTHKALLYLLRALKQQMETGEITTSRARAGARDFLFVHPDRGDTQPPATETLEGGIH